MVGPEDAARSAAARQARDRAVAAYDAAADHFDDPPLSFWERYGARTVDRLQLEPGSRVLDVACGSGASAVPAAQAVGPSGSVVGVDVSAGLLDLASAKAQRLGLTNLALRLEDMTTLRPGPEPYDVVVIVFGIFFVPDMETQVGTLLDLLRPGGRLAVTTWGPDWLEPMYSVWLDAVRDERPDLAGRFNPWDRLTDPAALAALLQAGGAVDVTVEAEPGSQPLTSAEDWWTMVLGSGPRWTVEQLEPAAAERVRTRSVGWAREHDVREVTTNVVYGLGRAPRR